MVGKYRWRSKKILHEKSPARRISPWFHDCRCWNHRGGDPAAEDTLYLWPIASPPQIMGHLFRTQAEGWPTVWTSFVESEKKALKECPLLTCSFSAQRGWPPIRALAIAGPIIMGGGLYRRGFRFQIKWHPLDYFSVKVEHKNTSYYEWKKTPDLISQFVIR